MTRAELTRAEKISASSLAATSSAPALLRRRSRLLGSSTGELEFSILTGEHTGRHVRIRGVKCTIGSGRGCTLRLRARGVQPLHCWILRGAGGTIVRRRHRDTQLNGRTFEDSVLSPGDRLRIGSVELEVSTCPAWLSDWSAETAQPTPVYDELDRELWERAARESSDSIDRLRGEMQDLERRATSQLAELNELIGRVSTERDSLQEQLRRAQDDVASERDTLLLDKQQLVAALAAGEQELAELRTHLTTREVEIESVLLTESRRVAEIQNRLEEVLRERSSLEARLHDQTASLRDQCTARQAERDSLQDECQRLDVQLAQLRELVGYTAAERDQLTHSVDGAQQLLAEQQKQLQQQNRELQSRLDSTQTRLAEAERRLAVVQVEGDSHLHGEMERVGQLQQRLERAELAKSELEAQLREQSSAWQVEKLRLSEQQGRLSEQCLQLEGQLKHVRELVESLAAEKDSLCEQLEAADLRLAAEQDAFRQERAALDQRLNDQGGSLSTAQLRCEQLKAELDERLYGNDSQAADWKRQADEYEEQIRALCEQLAGVTGRLAELQTAGEANREIESVLAAKRESQLEQSRDELAALQIKLADAETKLAAAQALSQSHQQSEQEQFGEWERRAGELQYQLAAAELKAAAAEDRLVGFQAEQARQVSEQSAHAEEGCKHAADLERQASSAAQWEQRATEMEAARAVLAAELAELTDAIRFERDSWQHDRDRLHQECRMLGQRLIQKQREYDSLQDEFKAAAKSQGEPAAAAQNTITMDQIREQVAASAELDEERAVWEAERDRLRQTIDELESQLAARPEFAQQMTIGPNAVADLQSQTESAEQNRQASKRLAELELQLESARCELDESRSWKDRAAATATELEERQAQNHQLRNELAALQREIAATRAAAPVAAAADTPEHAQLAELQQLHEAQALELQTEQKTLAVQRAQLATESELVAVAQKELVAQQQELQQTQAEFEGRWRLWEENLRRQEELLQRQTDELAQRVAGAESQLAASASQEQAFAARQAQLQAEESRLAELQADWERRQAELVHPAACAPPLAAAPVAADKSLNIAAAEPAQEAIAEEYRAGDAGQPDEMQNAPVLADPVMPEHFAPQFAPSSTPAGETPKPVWNQPGETAPPADDDSIEAYMSRLLKRVRGDLPIASPSIASSPVPTPAPAAAAPQPVDAVENAPRAVDVAIEPVKPEDYVPRQKAPELTTNMAAMRELANSAARTAIVKHQKRSGHQQALMQSVGAFLTLGCGFAAAWGAYYFRSIPAGVAAAIGFAAALYWGGKAALHALRIMMLKAPVCSNADDESASDASLGAAAEVNAAAGDSCVPEAPADPTETLHPDYIAPELSQPSQAPHVT